MPTPLGNLRDITLRALDVFREADLIAAEDTRVARRLLSAHGISGKRLLSYREQNAADATPTILAAARAGTVALVTDAGMPGVSDPGRDLVIAARAVGIVVQVLPGPVAYICAAVLSGFDLARLTFGGFLPRAAGALRTALADALAGEGPTAWYESPHRIAATLDALDALAPEARVFVARELTKLHEQQVAGTPSEVKAALPEPVRGEIVLVVAPRPTDAPVSQDDLDLRIDTLLDAGMTASAVAKAAAAGSGVPRAEISVRVVARKRARGDARHKGN